MENFYQIYFLELGQTALSYELLLIVRILRAIFLIFLFIFEIISLYKVEAYISCCNEQRFLDRIYSQKLSLSIALIYLLLFSIIILFSF